VHPTDFLMGSFEFETVITKDADGYYVAEALGHKVRHPYQDQAVNDLNQLLSDKMERGELIPNQ
jgi:hypothetical protein